MTTGITADNASAETMPVAMESEAVLLAGSQLVSNVLASGAGYPVSICIEDVWYVFSDENTYEAVYSQAEANHRIDGLRASVLG